MKISSNERDRLLNFIGYGKLSAPIWFLGMEEGTGGKDYPKIEDNIRVRAQKFQLIEDLETSHGYFGLQIPQQRTFTPVWIWMAKLVRGIQGETDWSDVQKAKQYIRSHLGRQSDSGKTFLTELLPLPAKGIKSWPYTEIYPSREEYVQKELSRRLCQLIKLIKENEPAYVLVYGSKYRQECRQKFFFCEWQILDASKQIEASRTGKTKVALLPFFGNGRLSSGDAEKVIKFFR